MTSHPTLPGGLDRAAVAARDLAARVELGLLLGRCHAAELDPVRELGALAALAAAVREGRAWSGELCGSAVHVCPLPPAAVAEEELEEDTRLSLTPAGQAAAVRAA